MASEGAKLALIAQDEIAMRVLAAWACAGIPLVAIETDGTIDTIAKLADINITIAARALQRVRATGCLLDGDISSLADRMLQQRVLSATKGKK